MDQSLACSRHNLVTVRNFISRLGTKKDCILYSETLSKLEKKKKCSEDSSRSYLKAFKKKKSILDILNHTLVHWLNQACDIGW